MENFQEMPRWDSPGSATQEETTEVLIESIHSADSHSCAGRFDTLQSRGDTSAAPTLLFLRMEHQIFYRVLYHPVFVFFWFVYIRSRVKTGSSSHPQESNRMISSSRVATDGKFPDFWSDKGSKSVLGIGRETSVPFASEKDYFFLSWTIVYWHSEGLVFVCGFFCDHS